MPELRLCYRPAVRVILARHRGVGKGVSVLSDCRVDDVKVISQCVGGIEEGVAILRDCRESHLFLGLK